MTGDDRRMTEVSRASSPRVPLARLQSTARAPNNDFQTNEILVSCAAQQQETVHEAARFRTKCGRLARIASGLLTQLGARQPNQLARGTIAIATWRAGGGAGCRARRP